MTTQQELYEQHSVEIDRLIRMRLASIYVPGYAYEDLVQEGRLAALEALNGYDDTRGKLGSYLTRVIANAYYGLLGAVYAQKRNPTLLTSIEIAHCPDRHGGVGRSGGLGESVVKALTDPSPNTEQMALIIEQAQTIRRAIEGAQRRLGEMEQMVMNCYMAPPPELLTTIRNLGRRRLSKRVMAMYLGISPDKIQSIICRIRTEVSDLMEIDE